MNFKIRAAAITVATSLVAVPLALSGTAFAQEDQPTGYIGGVVFNDLNGDGVQQGNEPGIPDVDVMVKGPDGAAHPFPTSSTGIWTVKRAPRGQYEISYVDSKFGNTTPSSVKAEIGEGDTPAVNFGVRGGSICGTAWSDTNEDGKRQAGEPVLPGRRIYVKETDELVETGADGGYCFDNLPAGNYSLAVTKKTGDPLVLTKPYGDSKFDWNTAQSSVFKIGKGEQVKGIDAGFIKLRADLKAVQIVVNNPHATDQNTFKVGDTLDIYGSLWANGNAPESLSGTLTLPEGLRIVGPIGGLAPGAVVQGQQVLLPHGLRQNPGLAEFLGAKVVVEKEFTGGEIKWEVGNDNVDSDPSNNVLIRKINAVAAQPQPQPQGDPAPKGPEIKKTAALANTGADPVAAGAVGLGALTLGGLALFAARRRRSA